MEHRYHAQGGTTNRIVLSYPHIPDDDFPWFPGPEDYYKSDLDLKLYVGGTLVGSSSYGTRQPFEIIDYTPSSDQIGRIKVYKYSWDSRVSSLRIGLAYGSSYNFGTAADPVDDDGYENNDSSSTASPISTGAHNGLRLSDEDWYAVSVPAGSQLTVSIAFDDDIRNLDLKLYDASQAEVDSSTGTGDSESVTYTNTSFQARNCYPRVYGHQDARNVYSMDVSIPDLSPPTPNPMTWVFEPYETSTSSISMTATAGTDASTPVEYQFDFFSSPTGGSGGTDRAWDTSRTYADAGLQTNHRYGYRVRARDSAASPNVGSYSSVSYDYTDIQTPSGIDFGTIATTSIQARSANTLSGLTRGSSGLIIYNLTRGTNSGWKQNNDFWNSGSLSVNTRYGFKATARNGDADATGDSPTSYRYTLANPPETAAFSDVTPTSIRANWTSNSNPGGTEYLCENTARGTHSGWTTNTYWNETGLNPGQEYAYRVKSRNGDDVETGVTDLGSQRTLSGDLDPPTAQSFNPLGDATGVALDTNLVIDFNENVQKGSGNIVIKRSSDDSLFETILVTSARVTISSDVATIDPASDFAGNTGYYVQIDNGAFEDTSGNDWPGIGDATMWNFTTIVLTGGAIHGRKWQDLDGDGVWDAGEWGLPGWTIYLDSNNNGLLDTGEPSTVTSQAGPTTEDQSQDSVDYGYWFDQSAARWQEFVPSLPWLTQVSVVVLRVGNPGDMWVAVEEASSGETIWSRQVAESQTPTVSSWLDVTLDSPVRLTPGERYRLVVWGDQPSPDASNLYVWGGQTAIDAYPQGITDLDGVLPGFDYAFRTSGSEMQAGDYWFMDLPPGTHTVAEVLQPGWVQTFPGSAAMVDQFQLNGADQIRAIHSTLPVGQTFTVGQSGVLSGIELSLLEQGVSGDLMLEILDMNGGDIASAPVLGNISIPETVLGPAPTVLQLNSTSATFIDLSGLGINVSAGETLAFRLSTRP